MLDDVERAGNPVTITGMWGRSDYSGTKRKREWCSNDRNRVAIRLNAVHIPSPGVTRNCPVCPASQITEINALGPRL